ncbi:hypothetical protein [Halobacterium yunchengense]|uniref:hypothetical protein n=1 Tax=Halobacterium yunchengense TaxID=3108497 RepID=UPI00300916E9
MAVELRPTVAVLVLVAVLAVGTAGSIAVADAQEPERPERVESIPLPEEDRELWLYTSTGRTFSSPTLSLNVVVYGDADAVRRYLLEGTGNWNETAADEQDAAVSEEAAAQARAAPWETATGAQRYVYLADAQRGRWLAEAYQVHDGTYLGSRHHVRAYTAPDEDGWTAMQAHHEHWDWFFGKHVVTSTTETQSYVEREFAGSPWTPEIQRVPMSQGPDDGFEEWLTVVNLRERPVPSVALFAVVAAVGARAGGVRRWLRERASSGDANAVLTAVSLVALFRTFRVTAVWLEGTLDVPPKALAFALYPVLFVGLPVTAYALSRRLDRVRAFAAGALGFLAAVLVDYSALGVTQVPLHVLVHRSALAVAVGLVAVGATRVERERPAGTSHVRVGVLLWLVASGAPLLQHTPLPV